mgnify:CR=1 FL=1
MTLDKLDALDALLAKMTPGPWSVAGPFDADTGFGKWWDVWSATGSVAHVAEDARSDEGIPRCKADVAAIVALMNAAPALLAEIRAARVWHEHARLQTQCPQCVSLIRTYDAARAATEAGGSDAQ